MKRKRRIFFGFFVLSFAYVLTVEPAGLRVSPAGFILQNLKPGETYDVYGTTGVRLTVYNESEHESTYVMSACRPSDAGGIWEKGYLEIPDPGWCRFEKDEITVPAGGRGYGKIYVSIPDGERYYNQNWVVTLNVKGKPGPGGIALAINIRVKIETAGNPSVKEAPYGKTGIVPSVLKFETAEGKREITVFNDRPSAAEYKIRFAGKEETIKTYLSSGYEAVPDPGWLKADRQVLKIPPHGRAGFTLEVSVPEGERQPGKKWEQVVFIEDTETAGFFRVYIVNER